MNCDLEGAKGLQKIDRLHKQHSMTKEQLVDLAMQKRACECDCHQRSRGNFDFTFMKRLPACDTIYGWLAALNGKDMSSRCLRVESGGIDL
jgi:hypothetical protein